MVLATHQNGSTCWNIITKYQLYILTEAFLLEIDSDYCVDK